MTTGKMEPFKNQCQTCATTHINAKRQEVPGTMHCKDPQFAYLMACSCWDYMEKEVFDPDAPLSERNNPFRFDLVNGGRKIQ